MKILTVENDVYELDTVPDEIDDTASFVTAPVEAIPKSYIAEEAAAAIHLAGLRHLEKHGPSRAEKLTDAAVVIGNNLRRGNRERSKSRPKERPSV